MHEGSFDSLKPSQEYFLCELRIDSWLSIHIKWLFPSKDEVNDELFGTASLEMSFYMGIALEMIVSYA